MLLRLLTTCFIFLLALPAQAATWIVDLAQSKLTFTATQDGRAFTGSFGSFDAKINYDAAALDQASVEVTIPLTGMDAGTAERNDELQKNDWFNTPQFPTAHFAAKGFEPAISDPPSLKTSGTLTIKDVSQPVTLQFQLAEDGTTATATGTATLSRLAFGLGAKDYPDGKSISTDVTVQFVLVARKAE
jgi:polyisoprenoid-binding protein YceI